MKLGDLADIRTGFTARSGLGSDGGAVRALQAGDMPEDGAIAIDTLPAFEPSAKVSRWLLKDGDVVFRGRGEIRATTYRGASGTVMAVSPLLILRPRCSDLLPEFIAMFLRSPKAAAQLARGQRGTDLRFIGKGDVEKLDIPTPTVEQQRRLIELDRLARRERELTAELSRLRGKTLAVAFDRCQTVPDVPESGGHRERVHGSA